MRDQYRKKVMPKNTTTTEQLCSQNLRAEFLVICPSVNHTGGFSKVSTFLIVTPLKSWLFTACVTVDNIQPPIQCSLSEKEHYVSFQTSVKNAWCQRSLSLHFHMFFFAKAHTALYRNVIIKHQCKKPVEAFPSACTQSQAFACIKERFHYKGCSFIVRLCHVHLHFQSHKSGTLTLHARACVLSSVNILICSV